MAKRKAKRSEAEAPTLNCLLLCNDVHVSVKTSTHTLVGVVDIIRVPSVPIYVNGLCVYMRISNVYGQQRVRVKWQHDGAEAPALEFEVMTHPQANPLGLITTYTPLPPLAVMKTGRHLLIAEYNDVPIGQLPIDVHGPPEPEEPPNDVHDRLPSSPGD